MHPKLATLELHCVGQNVGCPNAVGAQILRKKSGRAPVPGSEIQKAGCLAPGSEVPRHDLFYGIVDLQTGAEIRHQAKNSRPACLFAIDVHLVAGGDPQVWYRAKLPLHHASNRWILGICLIERRCHL